MKRFLLCFLFLSLGLVGSLRADESIRALQSRLKAGGFYFGEVNGRYDSDTAAAVTRYQIRNGLEITGKLDEATRYALGISATAPKVPMPRFGEDVWRSLRKSDQAAIDRMIAEQEKKQPKSAKTSAARVSPPPPAEGPPPPAQTEPANHNTERLKDYVAAFILAGLDPEVGAETEFFAERVNYFGESGVPREKIRRDLQRYNARWPQRAFTLAGELEVKPVQERLSVTFPLRYELRSNSKRAAGKVFKTLILEKTGTSDLQIVSVNERKTK